MTWNTLRTRAQQLGFDINYRTRPADGGGYLPELMTPPPEEGPWICVGSYEQVAGIWLHPITEAARDWSPDRVSAAMASADPFIAPVKDYAGDFSADFLAAGISAVNLAQNPDAGRMPA